MIDRGRRESSGSVLVLALWSLFLLSFFAVILGGQVQQKLELARRLSARDDCQAAFSAGIQRALSAARIQEEKEYQFLAESWSNDPFSFRDIDAGGGARADISHEIPGQAGEALTFYGLEDEESKININKASAQTLFRLFLIFGVEEGRAQNLAHSIVDWRDNDEFLSVPLGSAESSYYRGLRHPYEAKNANFETVDELLLVKEMDENIFKKVRKYITIYGAGRVNVNTASKPVLLALGLSPETADLVTGYRNGRDGVSGTADDMAFMFPGVAAELSSVYRLSASELTELSALDTLVGVRSRCFTARLRASVRGGKLDENAIAVINTKGEILYWSES